MITIQKRILRWGSRNRPYTRSNSGIYKLTNQRKFIAIHETGNRGKTAGAANHAAWLYNNPEMLVGYHFTVDHDKIYQHIPITEGAWHATDGVNGVGNRHSIGVEICVNMVDYDYNLYLKAINNAAWLCSELIKQENSLIYPNCIQQHNYFYKKNCPLVMRRDGLWPGFIKDVGSYIRGGQEPPQPPPVVPEVLRPIIIEINGQMTSHEAWLLKGNGIGTFGNLHPILTDLGYKVEGKGNILSIKG